MTNACYYWSLAGMLIQCRYLPCGPKVIYELETGLAFVRLIDYYILFHIYFRKSYKKPCKQLYMYVIIILPPIAAENVNSLHKQLYYSIVWIVTVAVVWKKITFCTLYSCMEIYSGHFKRALFLHFRILTPMMTHIVAT